jgi:hypothetical protein
LTVVTREAFGGGGDGGRGENEASKTSRQSGVERRVCVQLHDIMIRGWVANDVRGCVHLGAVLRRVPPPRCEREFEWP